MEYIYPDYYKEFHCTADKCPDTCCAGWQIYIDKKSLKKYLRKKGPFGSRLKNSIDIKEGCFYRYDNRCAFLNEDNLCDICLEMGEEHLCRTCARYPRHIEEYENVREISLSLSCPEAARIMLDKRDKTEFITEEISGREESYKDFDFFLYTKLSDIRTMFFEILQKRELSVANRMAMVTAMAHDLQKKISADRLCDLDEMMERFGNPLFAEKAMKRFQVYLGQEERRYDLIQEMLMTLHELEVLQDNWSAALWNDEWILYGTMTKKEYIQKRNLFLCEYDEWEIQKEQLLIYFIFTYFCGAVYDGRAYAKLKISIVHILLMEELLFAGRLQKGECLSRVEQTDIIHRYAREVEHSDWNLEYMEKIVQKRNVFSLENMLTAVLNG